MTATCPAMRPSPCRCVVKARAKLMAQPSQAQSPLSGTQRRYRWGTQQQGSLRLFLDSADVRQWEKYQHGTQYGFTTNPLILERDNVPCTLESFRYLSQQACNLGAEELQIQTWGGTAAAMEATALKILDVTGLYSGRSFVTIKLPCTPDGLSAASKLIGRDQTTRITITGVYNAHQVLLAQAVGAHYVAPYLGRIADQLCDNMQEALEGRRLTRSGRKALGWLQALETVSGMQNMVYKSDSRMRILVASIRDADQMAYLAAHGCDTFTFSPAVAEQLFMNPETLQAAEEFEAAAARNGGQ